MCTPNTAMQNPTAGTVEIAGSSKCTVGADPAPSLRSLPESPRSPFQNLWTRKHSLQISLKCQVLQVPHAPSAHPPASLSPKGLGGAVNRPFPSLRFRQALEKESEETDPRRSQKTGCVIDKAAHAFECSAEWACRPSQS